MTQIIMNCRHRCTWGPRLGVGSEDEIQNPRGVRKFKIRKNAILSSACSKTNFATTWRKRFFRQSAILSSACLVQSVILSCACPIFRLRQGRLDVARTPCFLKNHMLIVDFKSLLISPPQPSPARVGGGDVFEKTRYKIFLIIQCK